MIGLFQCYIGHEFTHVQGFFWPKIAEYYTLGPETPAGSDGPYKKYTVTAEHKAFLAK